MIKNQSKKLWRTLRVRHSFLGFIFNCVQLLTSLNLLSHHTNILCNDKSTQKNPTASSGTSIFVLSADILNHFVVKDIKIFTAFNDFSAIASRNT